MKLSKKLLAMLSAVALLTTATLFTSCSDGDDDNASGGVSFSEKNYKITKVKTVKKDDWGETYETVITATTKTYTFTEGSDTYVIAYSNPKTEANKTITYQDVSVKRNETEVEEEPERTGILEREDSSDGGTMSYVITFIDSANYKLTGVKKKSSGELVAVEETGTYTVDSSKNVITGTDSNGSQEIKYTDDGKTLTLEETDDDGIAITMTFIQQ